MTAKNLKIGVLPVLFCFFIMGFVDFVGIATNYIKQDFTLSDTLANTIPMMVFVWFAVFSIPTGILMGKIGRKPTVLLSLIITFVGLLTPMIWYSFGNMLLAFALVGIGNTIMQTSLNPLITNVVAPNRLTSVLTLGQFVKAIASFIGPILSAFMVARYGDWKLSFIVFAVITLLSGLWLYFTFIPRETADNVQVGFKQTLSLLNDKYILAIFLGILCIVGIDVGLNTSIPKLLMLKTGMPLTEAGYGTTLYFIARTAGAFLGAIILMSFSGNRFLQISVLVAVAALAGLLFANGIYVMYTFIFIVGFACANVFSILFSYALQHKEGSANEVSSLMIMGVAGGALIPFIMGWVADFAGQIAGISVLFICLLYLLMVSINLKKS